jgi:hypothetical protein
MHYTSKIKIIASERKVSLKKLSEIIEATPQGFSGMLRNDTLQIRNLQKIADHFKVPITYFFDVENNTDATIDRTFDILKTFVKSRMK